MKGAPRRGRNRLVSGAAETRATAASGTQRALVSGLSAMGDRDARTARAGPGLAPVPCPRPAPGRPRSVQAASCHWLAGQEKKKKKKLANSTSLPFPPGCMSYRARDMLSARAAALVSPPCTATSPSSRSYPRGSV